MIKELGDLRLGGDVRIAFQFSSRALTVELIKILQIHSYIK